MAPVQLIKTWTQAECKNCAKLICFNPELKIWMHVKNLSVHCYDGEAEPVPGTEGKNENENTNV